MNPTFFSTGGTMEVVVVDNEEEATSGDVADGEATSKELLNNRAVFTFLSAFVMTLF